MAEDGMLLNFSVGEAASFAPKQKLHGGSWRARRQAQRAVQRNGQKRRTVESSQQSDSGKRSATSNGNVQPRSRNQDEAAAPPPPAKRMRLDRPSSRDVRPVPAEKRGSSHATKERQVVSSLFRFNPISIAKPTESASVSDETPIEPSNAPLTAEAENFTSLGISAVLARHLTEKMNIKKPTAIQKAALTELLKSEGDSFVQAETGSGKTLAYLLPLVQNIMELSTKNPDVEAGKIHRDSGLFAIILAPTRELARQISTVLDALLRCAHWIVSGIVTGGEKKKSEKARLRKGLNILIATPGRLADHLQHTESLDAGQVRWLVLDEGDRLVELGFEEDIKKIINALDFRLEKAKKEGIVLDHLPQKRTTVLCSATMKMDVQRLGEISLKEARHIRAERSQFEATESMNGSNNQTAFRAPAQLKQSYAIIPAKLRLVTLLALLKSQFARKGSVNKIIVFISCADSVDLHYDIFARAKADDAEDDQEEDAADLKMRQTVPGQSVEATVSPSPHISSPSNPVQVYRLHGSLEQKLRTSTIKAFHASHEPAVLLCTDVASRGLDLPDVDLVIEYDPAFSREEHLHRIGRTARAGREGRAMVFLMPGCEESYVDVLSQDRQEGAIGLRRFSADELLKKAFGKPATGQDMKRNKEDMKDWEVAATDWQLDVERWALADPNVLEKARRAYQSHVRAYATHVTAERHCFDIKQLHLGHLAKAFALRDRPGSINVPGLRSSSAGTAKQRPRASNGRSEKSNGSRSANWDAEELSADVVDMQNAARKMKSMSRMQLSGAGEFNLG